MNVELVDIAKIKPDKNQPRKTFNEEHLRDSAESYKHHGAITPIEIDEDNVIILGELRWRAAKIAGLKKISCIRKSGLSKEERLERQLVENLNRQEMSIGELGKAIQRLKTLRACSQLTNHEIARRLGISPWTVNAALAFIEEPKYVKDAVKEEKISYRTALEIRKAPKEVQPKLIKKAIKDGWTVINAKSKVEFEKRLHESDPKIVKEIEVGHLICPRCNKKLRVIHREPAGHKLEEVIG